MTHPNAGPGSPPPAPNGWGGVRTPEKTYTRRVTVFSAECGFCEKGGEWESEDHRARWEEEHFEWTGHDDNFFEVTRQVEMKFVALRSREQAIRDEMRGRP